LAEFAGMLDGELPQLEIVEPVLFLQRLRIGDAFRADVNSYYARARPANGIVRGLGCAAARDENAAVITIRFARPKEVRLGAPAIVVPGAPVGSEIVDRRRVGMALVEVTNPPRDRRVFVEPRGTIREALAPAPARRRG
jgi:hypothetical protein